MKLSKAQKEIDQKLKELQAKDKTILDLKQAQSRNDKILKKHMDENKALKKGGASAGGSAAPAKENLPQKRDLKAMRANKKANAEKNLEDFNAKFLSDLQGQIDEMFQKVEGKQFASIADTSKTTASEADADTNLDGSSEQPKEALDKSTELIEK